MGVGKAMVFYDWHAGMSARSQLERYQKSPVDKLSLNVLRDESIDGIL